MLRRLFYVFNIIVIMALFTQGGNSQIGQAASSVTLNGTFLVVWGDGGQGSSSITSYFLAMDENEIVELIVNETLLASTGGSVALNHREVGVSGIWQEIGRTLLVQTISLANGEQAGPEGIYGPQPWVSILCKFNDISDEPENLEYFKAMYSMDYPGLDHFWRQNSYDLANLEGSGASGWYVLPYPRDHYLPGGDLDWDAAAKDCTAAAEADVYFPDYVGINLMFNAELDEYAWGGAWYLCLDGVCQVWRMTWEPPWGYQNIGVIAHETGHGFGLPHSYWNPNQVYDNQWDVMSDVWSNGSRGGNDPIYGTMGQHTIAYHKELLGWLEGSQMATIPIGHTHTLTLERLALPQTDNYRVARILVNNSPYHFLTVEARQLTGYDAWLPHLAGWDKSVVMHDIHITDGMPARVIDIDQNGNTGDAGAIWLPGETYITPTLGIEMSVLSATDTGFVVKISNEFTQTSSVEIDGMNVGYMDESIPFTATVSPEDATIPITYTWEATGQAPIQHLAGRIDSVAFTWDEAGTKAITVTASNEGGSVVDSHIINIAPKVPIVSLSGPAGGKVGATNVFTATVTPLDVIQPVTYVWQASGQSPITHTNGLSDTVSYRWDDAGLQIITVTAQNILGSTSDSISLPVRVPPAQLEVSGPETGEVGADYLFNATINPITTTIPITYVWSVDNGVPIIHTGGINDNLMLSWDQPGEHIITVSATNPAGIVVDAWSITIYIRVYMPLGMRN